MKIAWLAVFQVLVAAGFTFVGAWALASLGVKALRLRDGRVRLAVALVPFAKLVFEVARGVPANSFFWEKVQGAQQELGSFRVGLGLNHFLPIIDLELGARWRGALYPESVADPLLTVLDRYVGSGVPAAIAFVVVAIALVRIGVYIASLVRHDPSGARAAVAGATLLEERTVRFAFRWQRRVAIVLSSSYDGAPFAMGLWRPVICLPSRAITALTNEERDAVIAHEMGHIAGFHWPLVAVISALERAFWFLPGTGHLAREVRAQCEICADNAAVRSGFDPTTLASALVKVGEAVGPRRLVPALAFFDRVPVLRRRVQHLLTHRDARWYTVVARVTAAALLGALVLRATLFGNP